MMPGGVTEIIWHFAGYFHHIDEVAKERFVYEDGGVMVRPDDYVADLKESLFKPDLDEFDTDRTRQSNLHPTEASPVSALHPLGMRPMRAPHEADYEADGAGKVPLIPRPVVPISLAADDGHKVITLTYESGGEQQLLDVGQINTMSDDDQLLVLPDSGVTHLHDIDINETLQQMIDQAENQIPGSLALPQTGTEDASKFVAARDAETAENGGGDGEHSVGPGRYVNGELQNEPEQPATVEEPTLPDPAAKGQWAELGGNEATNAALIVDLKEGTNTMIVLGDFFKTNAIVQSNLFVDNDQIDIAGGHTSGIVINDENKADNIAEFEQKEGVFATLSGYFAGLRWNVDVVDGDFYDVNLVSQKNILRDNDVAVQETQQTHYEAHLGENEQLNLTQIFDGEIHYDLIVICGDFHGANWIFQYNILLDPDILKIAAGGDAGDATSQSASSGQNFLLNDATIVTYGDDHFAAPGGEMTDLLAGLASETGTLDPSLGWLIPGNGSGVLNILYVTGDYYDINAIWQVNIIADVDTAIQFLAAQPPEDIAGDGTLTQSAATGDNEATNDAVIVDVGSTSSLVAGDVYQDTILIQGNLVTEDNDKVVYGDTTALVSEIIAFTGDDTEQQNDMTHVKAPILPDDTMGSTMT